MKKFLGIEDNEKQRALWLVGDEGADSRGESDEAREARIKQQYEDSMRSFAKGDAEGTKTSLLSLVEELNKTAAKAKKDWEAQIVYLARRNLAEIEETSGNCSKALDHYLAAVKEDDSNVIVWLRAGKCAARLGLLHVARRAFEGGLLARPEHCLCLEGLNSVLGALGERDCRPESGRLLRLRRAAEREEFNMDVVELDETIHVEADAVTWSSVIGALIRTMRQRLKHKLTCSAVTVLKFKQGVEEKRLESRELKAQVSQILSQKRPASCAISSSGLTGATTRASSTGSATGDPVSTDADSERPRKSRRQEKIQQMLSEGRRRSQQKREENKVDLEATLLKLLPVHEALKADPIQKVITADENTAHRDPCAKKSTSQQAKGAPQDSHAAFHATCRADDPEEDEEDQVIRFVQDTQKQREGPEKKRGQLGLLWQAMLSLSNVQSGARHEELRRVWKALKPHYHSGSLPAEVSIALAEAFLPSQSLVNEKNEPVIPSDEESTHAEFQKRVYDAELVLSRFTLCRPLGLVLESGDRDEIAFDARIAFAKGELLHLRCRTREAMGWYERCSSLLDFLVDVEDEPSPGKNSDDMKVEDEPLVVKPEDTTLAVNPDRENTPAGEAEEDTKVATDMSPGKAPPRRPPKSWRVDFSLQKPLVDRRVRFLASSSFLEEARSRIENGEYAVILPILWPVVRASVDEQQFRDPQLAAKVQLLRSCCEKAGDNASVLACRAIELKLAVREARLRAVQEAASGTAARVESTSLLPVLKKASSKVKDITSFEGGDDTGIVEVRGVAGWSLLEAVRLAAEGFAAVAAVISEDLRAAHPHRTGTMRSSSSVDPGRSSDKNKRLALARAMLGYSRAFWFLIRWSGPSSTSTTVVAAGGTSGAATTTTTNASVQLLLAVRFALHQLAACHAVRADGTSGAVIKFYASVLRERHSDLTSGRVWPPPSGGEEEVDEEERGGESDEVDEDNPAIWNNAAFCRQELAQCYKVLYDIPILEHGVGTWLTESCSRSGDGSGASAGGNPGGVGVKDDKSKRTGGGGGGGGESGSSLDIDACGHVLEFYRASILRAVRADRDRNMKRVMELLTTLSSALDGTPFLDTEAVVSLSAVERLCMDAWRSDEAAERVLLSCLKGEQRAAAVRTTVYNTTSNTLSPQPRGGGGKVLPGWSVYATTLYETRMLRAAAILRVTENEFKRRKEPERRSDIEEVLDSLLEAAQEVKEALRVRPCSVTAWRRLGCVLRDVGNTALDVEAVLGKGRSSVEDPKVPLCESIGCYRLAAQFMEAPGVPIVPPLPSTARRVIDVDDMDDPPPLPSAAKPPLERDVLTPWERQVVMKCSLYDAGTGLDVLAREERLRGASGREEARMALDCLRRADELPPVHNDFVFAGIGGVDFDDCRDLVQLRWFYKYLRARLELKLWEGGRERGSSSSLMGSFALLQDAVREQKEAEGLRARKSSTQAPEVEAEYRLLATLAKLCMQLFVEEEDGEDGGKGIDTTSRDDKLLQHMESILARRRSQDGDGKEEETTLENGRRSRLQSLTRRLVRLLERCRSKDVQEFGEYYYKSVYRAALATWKVLGNATSALEKLSVLFRPDVGERGYFYLLWNYRFTDLCRNTFLETERKHYLWRSKCLRLYVELLSACEDHSRLWSVFLRGRRRSKDDAFEPGVKLLVIHAYAKAAVKEEPDGKTSLLRMKRAWDAMEETTRILHERQGSGFGKEPTFIALKQLMEHCYLQLSVGEEDREVAGSTPAELFKAAVRFCGKRWNADQRIAKRALAALAEMEEEQGAAASAGIAAAGVATEPQKGTTQQQQNPVQVVGV